jgi:hypothetical protein
MAADTATHSMRPAPAGSGSGSGVESLAEAERLFWNCEKHARIHAWDATGAAACSNAYELILRSRFRGSFSDLMKWWNHEKNANNP